MPMGIATLAFYFAWNLARDKLCAGGRNLKISPTAITKDTAAHTSSCEAVTHRRMHHNQLGLLLVDYLDRNRCL